MFNVDLTRNIPYYPGKVCTRYCAPLHRVGTPTHSCVTYRIHAYIYSVLVELQGNTALYVPACVRISAYKKPRLYELCPCMRSRYNRIHKIKAIPPVNARAVGCRTPGTDSTSKNREFYTIVNDSNALVSDVFVLFICMVVSTCSAMCDLP